MEKRVKKLEIELSYLRKELEELREKIPEVHTHYHYDFTGTNPVIVSRKE